LQVATRPICLQKLTVDVNGLTEHDGHENAGHEFARCDKYSMKTDFKVDTN